MDSGFNLVARAYYDRSEELLVLMEALKVIPYVKGVRFSEISAIIDRRAFSEKETLRP
jgi:hypothetical protein